jgi:hypothetical protein
VAGIPKAILAGMALASKDLRHRGYIGNYGFRIPGSWQLAAPV